MKIAVISDIHANFVALQTVAEHISAWHPDHVVVTGDLVNRGPRPAECLDFVQEKTKNANWLVVRGNHEDYVISNAKPASPRKGSAFEVHRASFWTFQQLGNDISLLKAMPFQQSLIGPDGNAARFLHASMSSIRDGIYPETNDESLRNKIFPQKDSLDQNHNLALFCVGHTHRALIRNLGGVLIINAGSAGLPFDGNRKLAYAQLTWQGNQWHSRIIRLDYDLHQAERDFYSTGYLENAGPLVRLVQIELRTASSQLYNWAVKYQNSVLNGDLSMQESVNRYLEDIGINGTIKS